MSGAISHWWKQRLSSVILIPLALWLLWAGVSLTGVDHAAAVAFMSKPVNAILAGLMALVSLYHAQSGITVIVEDYIPGKLFPAVLIMVTRIGCGLGVVAAVWALFRISAGS